MKNHITKFLAVAGFIVVGILGLATVDNASAKTTNLRVTPTQYHYTLNPGETKTDTFKFSNEGDYTVQYTVEATPYFVEIGEDGKTSVSYKSKESYNLITDWVKIDKTSGSLDPNESAFITFTIDVPTDVPGGGQYFVPMVTTTVEKEDGKEMTSIGEAASIGPVVYATVNGETRVKANIVSNDVSGFLFNPPIQANSRITNEGNIHAEATYIMRVYPIFGGESIYNNEDNPNVEVIFPGTSRYYTTSWTAEQGAPSIGIYKVQSEVKVFDEVSKVEKVVIICPMWVLILIAVFILAVIFWLVARAKSRKAEKK